MMALPAPTRLVATGFQSCIDGGDYTKLELIDAISSYPMFEGLLLEEPQYQERFQAHATPARLTFTIKG